MKKDRVASLAADWNGALPRPFLLIEAQMAGRVDMLEYRAPMRARNDMQRTIFQIRIDAIAEHAARPFEAMFEVRRILVQIFGVPADRLLIKALPVDEQFHIR